VGYKLYREVRDFAPASWTPAERAVAWVIADHAGEATRISLIELPLLCHRTGLSPRGIRAALQGLREHGYEFRRPFGNDRNGNPVYAARSHRPEYQVPCMVNIGIASMTPEGDRSVPP
jgi:hypothetical protein